MLKCSISLIGQAKFLRSCHSNFRESAMLSLVNTLNRVYDDNEKMRPYRERGERIEGLVNKFLNAPMTNEQIDEVKKTVEYPDLMDTFKEIKSGSFKLQQWVKLELSKEETGIDDVTFWGKTDIETRSTIYDIKTCNKYTESKYTESLQHHAYLAGRLNDAMPKTMDFKYMVFECGPIDNEWKKPKYYEIKIENQGPRHKQWVIDEYKDFLEYIRFIGLWDAYIKYSNTK